jgi:putative spermidine/putrescine transport system ATP-binding protein
MSFVAVQNFAKSFGAVSVFADIDLDVAEGEICILLGPSGCGKTTLLRAIAGLVQQDRGTLSIAGQDVSRLSPAQRGVAMTFQHYALFPNMTVRQNLAFGLERKRLARSEVVRKVDAALALMELGPRADARPGQLSGGQKQRVALARALVLEPRLLLLDEPLSALDAQIRKRLRDELKRIQRETGLTSILVTHDQEEALVLGDRVAVMNAGRIVQVDAARTLYDRPATRFVAGFIGDFNLLEPAVVERLFSVRPPHAWAIHPEAFDVRMSTADSYVLQGTVTDQRVQGATVRYLVAVGDTVLKVDVLNRTSVAMFGQGEAIKLYLDRTQPREIRD